MSSQFSVLASMLAVVTRERWSGFGRLAFASGGGDAPAPLMKAARQLEPLDAALVRHTYL